MYFWNDSNWNSLENNVLFSLDFSGKIGTFSQNLYEIMSGRWGRWKIQSNPFPYQVEGNQCIFWDQKYLVIGIIDKRNKGAWYLLLIVINQPYYVKPSNLFKLLLQIWSSFSYGGQDHLRWVFSVLVIIEAILACLEGFFGLLLLWTLLPHLQQ